MSLRIHHIVTGEAESPLATTLLNEGVGRDVDPANVIPFGYREDLVRNDGTVVAGAMVPMPVWLIEGADRLILVDTGVGDPEELGPIFDKYGPRWIVTKTREQEIEYALGQHGVTPHDIDTVVLTHLHWDHIGNNELFDRARFLVQRDELLQSLVPPRHGMFYYPEYRHKMLAVLDQIELLDGDARVCPGVRVLKIGGHTPGCMAVMVDTDLGTVGLTSDIMYSYRTLELNWPIGSYWDMAELMRGYSRLRLEADVLVPNHDWEIREHFPSGTIG